MNMTASKKIRSAVALCLLLSLCCVSGLAQSYKLGDEADEIATIQTALTTLKLYTGSITGHYGEKTQAAVQTFQKKYALTSDGIAGDDTIKALYDAAGIDAEIKRLQAKKSAIANSQDRMKKTLEGAMIATGKVKFMTDLFSFNI